MGEQFTDVERPAAWRRPVVERVRLEIGFEWLSGGRYREPGSEGNGQPQNDRGWGLWRATAPAAADFTPGDHR